ncbi:hypothetical protein Bca4012_040889 [Brassica carinata]
MSSTSSSHPQTITVLWQLRKKVTIFSEKKDKSLKTRKLREAEEAARRAKLTKAVIRVRFPDNHTLEATFHPSEKLQSLADLLKRALAHTHNPYLNEEMKDVEAIIKEAEPVEPSSEPVTTVPVDQNPRRRRRPQSLSGLKCD